MSKKPILCVAVALSALNLGCEPAPSVPGGALHLPARTNVVLITLDTTRADRLGCYGYAKAETPTLDALAAQGTLFENAYAQVPLTLPSHATILTGRYPKEHGIRLNGRDALAASYPTLAQTFKDHGYTTGAFLASSVLDARYRLDRGFDHYDDDMGRQQDGSVGADVQRRADRVTDAALVWLDGVKSQPFFGWFHYYDPHYPYDPPTPFRGSLEDPYDGEIAFVDAQIKRIIEYLETNSLRDQTLIVVVGDHGESFGEHGEEGHTLFLYETNLRVPLILSHPILPGGQRIDSVVEAVDVFPTVLSSLGWTVPDGLLSRSLWGVVGFDVIDGSYAESLYGWGSFGWAQQHSLTTRRWKYISSTIPELYDLAADPVERRNVIADYPQVAEQMRETLAARYNNMKPGTAGTVALSASARRGLESLGYLSANLAPEMPEFLTPDAPDPKRMVKTYALVTQSQDFLARGELNQAIPLLEQAATASPLSTAIHFLLGTSYQRLDRHADAVEPLLAGLRLDPKNPEMLLAVAGSLATIGRNDEAETHYRAALAFDAIAKDVKLAAAVRFNLAVIASQRGDPAAATQEYENVLRLDPGNEKSVAALVNVYLGAKRTGDAVRVLRDALPVAPNSLAILRPLASLLATAPDAAVRDGTLAVSLAERAVDISKRGDPVILATLAAAHAETGRFDLAIRLGTEAANVASQKRIPQLANFIETQVAAYRKGQPFRDNSLR